MKIALFGTCVNDALYSKTLVATQELLKYLGHEVVFPSDQTCCGQMHLNSGYRSEGLRLAQRFTQIFRQFDYVVSPSASWVGAVRELYSSAAKASGDDEGALRYNESAKSVYELSEFLVDVAKTPDVGAVFPHKVAYHPTCHSLRVLGITSQPYELLSHVRGLQLMELASPQSCCGFGGTFALKNADTSIAMGSDKLSDVHHCGADVLCALDNSCLMHLGGASSRLHNGLRTLHLAEILAQRT